MPTEIMEKIMGFIIPSKVLITAWYHETTGKQLRPFKWEPEWSRGLLLISKTIGRVVRKVFFQRIGFDTWGEGAYTYTKAVFITDEVPADVKRKAREHFEAVFASDD